MTKQLSYIHSFYGGLTPYVLADAKQSWHVNVHLGGSFMLTSLERGAVNPKPTMTQIQEILDYCNDIDSNKYV